MTAITRLPGIAIQGQSTLTIASGVITVTQGFHVVAAESGNTDDLATITPGYATLHVAGVDFRPILCLTADVGDTITLKHGTGNILLPGAADIDITENEVVWLLYDGTNWKANSVGSSGGAGTVTSVGLSTDAGWLTVGSSPVTSSGTITLNKTTGQTQNQVIASPNGSSGVVGLRALVKADIPAIGGAFGASSELTIASGAIDVSGGGFHFTIDTESDASTDNLDSIMNIESGRAYLLRLENAARNVIIKHGTGNLFTFTGADYELDGAEQGVVAVAIGSNVLIVGPAPSIPVTHEQGGLEANVSAYDGLIRIASGSTSNIKCNYSATAAPTTGDDTGDGYSVGSLWYDTTNDKAYTCLDATASAAVWKEITPGSSVPSRAVLEDQKTSGTNGGNSTATTWTTRDLNTEVSDPDSIVTLSSNLFTPISGTYEIDVDSHLVSVGRFRIRLYNNTAAANVVRSVQYSAPSGTGSNGRIVYRFTANGTDAYAIQYYCQSGVTNGLGVAMSEASVNEVYTRVILDKVA